MGQAVGPALKSMLSGLIAPSVDILKNTKKEQYHEQDAWKISAVHIPMKQGFQWPPYNAGFTVALWVKMSQEMELVKSRCRSRTGNCVYASSSEGEPI